MSGRLYPLATAEHEAGHALVAYALGIPVDSARLNRDGYAGGRVVTSCDGAFDLDERVAVCAAGVAAWSVTGTIDKLADVGTHISGDVDNVTELVLEKHPLAGGDEIDRRTARLFQRGARTAARIIERNRGAFDLLVNRLMFYKELDGEAVAALLKRCRVRLPTPAVDPTAPPTRRIIATVTHADGRSRKHVLVTLPGRAA